MFEDRRDAGRRLAQLLRSEPAIEHGVVLGIPRGGVVVAAEVARELGLPLDVVIAAKVGAPGNPEFAIGAVTPDGGVVANADVGVSDEDVLLRAGEATSKVRHRVLELRGGSETLDVSGRTAIVVDDGLATGLTALAAVRYLHRLGAKRVVLAVPVASSSAVDLLKPEVEELVVDDVPAYFAAVGQFYRRFDQTEDAEVKDLLSRFKSPKL